MLPPLSALQAFEAAATAQSFRDAADRLNVTPSAVSHRIRALEDLLGVELFERTTRRVALTDAGVAYLPPVREALHRLEVATDLVSRRPKRMRVTVSAAPSFAMSWLMQRLPRFQVAHPDIEVRLDTSVELVDLWGSDVDMAVRHTATPHRAGLEAHWLFGEPLIAVCSPDMADRDALRKVEDLRHARRIQTLHRLGQWQEWLKAAGLDGETTGPALTVEYDSVAVEAALDGLGVALVGEPFVHHHIDTGRLVRLFSLAVNSEHAYYLVYPRERRNEPHIAAFRDWLTAQAASTPTGTPAL